ALQLIFRYLTETQFACRRGGGFRGLYLYRVGFRFPESAFEFIERALAGAKFAAERLYEKRLVIRGRRRRGRRGRRRICRPFRQGLELQNDIAVLALGLGFGALEFTEQ